MPLRLSSRGVIGLLAALASFTPLSIDTYLPSLPVIAQQLNSDAAQVQLTIGLFLAGLCTGMLIYGPLSDRVGRRRPLLAGLVLYIIASLGCMLAPSVTALMGWRFLQAVGGAAALVLARTIARDVFDLGRAAQVLSLMHVISMVATLVAPMTGNWLAQWLGWRSVFAVLALMGAGCLLLSLWRLEETHPQALRSPSLWHAYRAYASVLREPRALGFIACMGCTFGGLFVFITASPFVFIEHFQLAPQTYTVLFALNIAGVIVATWCNARWVTRLGPPRVLRATTAVAAAAGVALAATSLAGWAVPGAIVPCVVVYIGMTGVIGANCTASLMALFPRQAGAAVGLAVALQFACGSLFSAWVGYLNDGTELPMCVLIGVAGLGCLASYRWASSEAAGAGTAERGAKGSRL
ncbi:multidrug effflux MFS transporter [Pseudomonas sp. KNUC1026]|uniref:multidrug effflux MFS transporter n=1 Tax=Pseudomonas sp. KNUC1026 TaxID=2893890 RepID=UPI001F3E51C0|nr:multidrug effflux MFS transporter [Pseudomonas sp. KNUC1026]UFH51246.1 multidrug effflux MFS transporter [Pseudomonas sp. KNUC1026]